MDNILEIHGELGKPALMWSSETVTIFAGGGKVVIHIDTGKVDSIDCDPDDAARAFWLSMAKVAPEIRQQLIKEGKPN